MTYLGNNFINLLLKYKVGWSLIIIVLNIVVIIQIISNEGFAHLPKMEM